MNLVAITFAFTVTVALVSTTKADTKTLFCYWGSWSTYRWGKGELRADQINPHNCTHLVYAFAGLNEENEIYSLDPWNDLPSSEGGYKDNFHKLVSVRAKNPNLKVLLSVGGWNQGSSKFSTMVNNDNSSNTFVSSVMRFLARYDFDGLDIAWLWPNQRGGRAEDKQSYVLLLQQLQKKFKSKSYTLSIAAPAIYSDSGYNLTEIMKYVDFVSVYAFDYVVNTHTLHHGSPLYNYKEPTFSVNNTIKAYLDHGAKAEQLLLGVTLYGRTYKFLNPQQANVGDAADGAGDNGPFTQELGLLAWFEVAYAKKNKLAGLTVWSIDNDDNHNICGDSLTSAISNAL